MNNLKSIDEIMREARERMDACFAAMNGSERQDQDRSRSGSNLMAFPEEQGDLMSFTPNILEPQRLQPYAQSPLNQGRIVSGLPRGPRLTRAQEEELKRQNEIKLNQLRAQGRIPKGYELPYPPEQTPEWAQSVPDDQGPMPQWPQQYPGEEEALPAPWPEEYDDDYVPPPPNDELLGEFDPLYSPTAQRRPATTSYFGELAPTWTATPASARVAAAAPAREIVDEFDPYATSAAPSVSPRSNYSELVGSPARNTTRRGVPGPSSRSTSPAPTSPEFVAEVDDIVKQTRARLNLAMKKEFGQDLETVLKKK